MKVKSEFTEKGVGGEGREAATTKNLKNIAIKGVENGEADGDVKFCVSVLSLYDNAIQSTEESPPIRRGNGIQSAVKWLALEKRSFQSILMKGRSKVKEKHRVLFWGPSYSQ